MKKLHGNWETPFDLIVVSVGWRCGGGYGKMEGEGWHPHSSRLDALRLHNETRHATVAEWLSGRTWEVLSKKLTFTTSGTLISCTVCFTFFNVNEDRWVLHQGLNRTFPPSRRKFNYSLQRFESLGKTIPLSNYYLTVLYSNSSL